MCPRDLPGEELLEVPVLQRANVRTPEKVSGEVPSVSPRSHPGRSFQVRLASTDNAQVSSLPPDPSSYPPFLLPGRADPWLPPGESILSSPQSPGRTFPVWVAVVAVALILAVGAAGYLVVDQARTPEGSQVAGTSADVPTTAPATEDTAEPQSPGPPAGRVVVTPAMAEQVVRRYWPVHTRALRDADLARIASLTSGSARRWEVNAVACGCIDADSIWPFLDASYFVPRQTGYPARFIAQVHTEYSSGQQGVELLVFSRSGRRAPWLVIENSYFGPMPGGQVRLGAPDATKDGFTRPVTAARRSRARSVARQLAAVWQEANDSGVVPVAHDFIMTGQAGDRLARIAEHPQDTVQSNGLLGHFTYRTTKADPLVVVSHSDGYDLACQPIRGRVTYSGQPGQVVYQDPSRKNWGPSVAPGQYRALMIRQAWQTCFLINENPAVQVIVFNQSTGGGPTTAIS